MMEGLKVLQVIAIIWSTVVVNVATVMGQISTPCTISMISSFTPCINYVTGSSNNGTSPTTSCCESLKSIMTTSMDCTCLVITANIPLQLPINRTLAISLPRACKMGGVPLQCKASGTPLPAPGPVLLGPTLPPPTAAAPDLMMSPQGPKAVAPAPESKSAITLAPSAASPPRSVPTTNTSTNSSSSNSTPTTTATTAAAGNNIKPVLTPSASSATSPSLPFLLPLPLLFFFHI